MLRSAMVRMMTEPTKLKIIFLQESLWESIGKDAFSAFMLLVLIGIGIMVNSPVLQVFAGVMFIFMLLIFAIRTPNTRMTVTEAKAYLETLGD